MSDDPRAAGAESQSETGPDDKKKKDENKHPLPVWPDGRPAVLADGWSEGAPTKLPVRGDDWVEFRPYLLVQELRYLSGEGKKAEKLGQDEIGWLREVMVYVTEWSFTFKFGPRKGEVMPLPAYDPYAQNPQNREQAIRARLAMADYLSVDDTFVMLDRLRWLRAEVAKQYAIPPAASEAPNQPTPSDNSSESQSA